MANTRPGSRASHVLIHIFLILGAIVMVFPFFWMLSCSLKTQGQITSTDIVWWPSPMKFENYLEATRPLPFLKLYYNTIMMVIGRVICALLFSSMAAYGHARLKFPGNNAIFAIVIIQQMVPGEIFILPQYQMCAALNVLNTNFALIFPGLVSAFGTFLLRQNFVSLPTELEEAAVLDGCNRWQIYYRILLPLCGSALVSLTVFTTLFAWKDLMWPLICNMDVNHFTLSSGLATVRDTFATKQGALMAASAISTFPLIFVYAFCQKYFIEGIAQTGMK